jgi:hypothetical protein
VLVSNQYNEDTFNDIINQLDKNIVLMNLQ